MNHKIDFAVQFTSFELESRHSPEKEATKCKMQLLIFCATLLLALTVAKKVTHLDEFVLREDNPGPGFLLEFRL